MAKSKDQNDPNSVDEFIRTLNPDFAKLIQEIRLAVLETDAVVGEQIKWNSPSFFYNDEMKAFDPKEYKRDIVVINARNNEALLVFPTGAIIDNKTGILEGNFPDARKTIRFKTLDEFNAKRKDLKSVVKDWLHKVEK